MISKRSQQSQNHGSRISRVAPTQNVKPLVYGRTFQNLSNPVCHERGLLTEFNHWSTVVLSVLMNVFDTGIVRALRISTFKRVASNAPCSSNFGMKSAFMGGTLDFPKTKATCVSSEVFTRARRKTTAQKTFSGLSTNMCSSTHSTGAVKRLRVILNFPRDGKPECQARNFVLISMGSS